MVDGGGDAMLFEATAVEGMTTAEIERMFRDARAKDYAQIESVLAVFGDKKPRERDAALGELAKLEEQLREVARIDYFPNGSADELRAALSVVRTRIEQRTSPSSAPPQREVLRAADYRGRVWVTRAGAKVDRVACAWFIRRFVDADAKLKFVELASYAPKRGELRFDMPEAEFTHVGEQRSFEVLCMCFGLSEPGLLRIAEIVHDLDIKDGRYLHPETEGIRALIGGIVLQHRRDEARVEAASMLFDALLAVHATAPTTRRKQ